MRGKARALAGLLAAALLLAGCGRSGAAGPEAEESVGYLESMDTVMTFTACGPKRQEALDMAQAEVLRLDALWSIGQEDSEISRLNRAGSATLSEDTAELVSQALALYEQTGGRFDITVCPLMELWGFYSKEYRVPSEEELAQALAKLGSGRLRFDAGTRLLRLDEGQALDLGGIAKGYASQKIIRLWRELGLTSGLVSLGGNIQCLGARPDGSPWRVGIRDPADGSGLALVVQVVDQAVVTSGGYERFFVDEATGTRYQHILDPSTGRPVDSGLASVSVVCPDGTLADGLSTALYIMGPEEAARYWRQHSGQFQAIFIDEAGEIAVTEGLTDAVSSQRELHVIRLSD